MTIRIHTLLVWLAALSLCSWWVFSQVSLRTDMSLFLPEGTAPDKQILLNEISQGPANRLLMLAIKQGDPVSRAGISQQLTAQLRQSRLFSRVENGAPSALEIDPLLFKYRYLISTDPPSAFDSDNLHSALKQRLEELKSPFPSPFKDLLASDPLGSYQSMLQRWLAEQKIARDQGVWQSKQGDMALLLVQTKAGGLELDQQQQILAYLSDQFSRLDTASEHQLLISGPAVFAVQSTLAFGITLLGVTLDYPIHLFSHLHPSQSVKDTMQAIWRTLRLGVYTTCIAYLVLLTTDFAGLRQLGLFTLSGLLTAAFTSRFMLPRLFAEPFSAPQPIGLEALNNLLRRSRWPSVVTISVAVMSLATLLLSSKPLWQDDIATLSPLPADLLKQDRALRQQFGASEPHHLLLIQGEDPEQLLQRSEALRRHLQQDQIGRSLISVALPSDFLPSQQQQRLKQQTLPNQDVLTANLKLAMQGLPFRDNAFAPFIAAIEQSRTLEPLDYPQALQTELKSRLETMIREFQSAWFALIPLQSKANPDQIKAYIGGNFRNVRYLNLRQEVSSQVADFRQQILQRISIGCGLMLILLWIGLGSLKRALTTLIPIGLAILATVGVLHLAGETLNLFHLISLMLVLGIGMDYSLFFNRHEQQQGDAHLTLHALSVCALSSAGVFAILASSSIPVLHAIGLTVAIGVAMSYLATYALSRVNS
ncbi:MAG: MMPL family transporter [Candidatus Thiodiazotropha sp.]